MGVYRRGNRLWLRLKDRSGKWVDRTTGLAVGREDEARRQLERIQRTLAAEREVAPTGKLSVKAWSERWLEQRRRAGLDGEGHDETRLRLHVLPTLGRLPLAEVRPRHVLEVVERLTRAGNAPRTIRNVYSVVQSLYRDAMIADLVESTPCILRRPHLPSVRDGQSEWRQGAIYSPDEVAALTQDTRVPQDRRVVYGLLGLAMLRHGEAAGLRWRHYRPELQPLGRLVVATSYNKGRTKSGAERWVPVHPALAALLAAWQLGGWAREMGRPPKAEDLIVPRTIGRRWGTMRSKEHSHYCADQDFAALDLRRRRLHDLRRTGISLAREGGAVPDLLRLVTHAPPRDVMSLYTTIGWATLCRQVEAIAAGSARVPTEVSSG